MSIIKLKNVSKFYRNKTTISSGFTKINLELDMGEFVVITGESGSGKSTLLNVISGLDSYEEGEMYINGEETSHYTEVDYENYRRKYIGNIFQHFNLVNSYTVYQNVELVLLLNGYSRSEAKSKVLDIIETVGLTKYKNAKAAKLSGGQKQRVAIARALAKDTPIIVTDEPTGNLDVKSARAIMKLLKDISREKLVIIVTHNYEQVEEYATRKISMNDGKIIEDKRLATTKSTPIEEVAYKDLSVSNKILLGVRNAFNIKTKFVLLFLVYFFLTLLVFGEYSGLRKVAYDEDLEGYNGYFVDTSPERIVLNKKDKTAFSESELNDLESLENIASVYSDDLLLDIQGGLYSNEIYLNCIIKPLSSFSGELAEGEMPSGTNEVIIEGYEYSYYFTGYQNGLIGKTFVLQENRRGSKVGDVTVKGIKYDDDDEAFFGDFTIYVSDEVLAKIASLLMLSYADVSISLNGKEYDNYSRFYFEVDVSKSLAKGEAYVPSNMNMYCSDYDCTNENFRIGAKNIYYSETKNLKVKRVLSKENYKNLLDTSEAYDEVSSTIFISEEDYRDMFAKGDYQISVFMKDAKESEKTKATLESMGYNAYLLKENMVNPNADFLGILKIIRSVFFIIAAVALFFISFFIIKIILKSRNVYYSTIRILGATRKISRQLLNIELLIDINVAYFVFLIAVKLASLGILSDKIFDLAGMVSFFTLRDYITIYIILIAMSLLISNRYAKKLFKDSAMNTYREEV